MPIFLGIQDHDFFWKSTSQLVTKWSYLTISVHNFPTKKNLDPHTPHQIPQITEAVYIDVSDSKGQDPECRGWGCPEFIARWWQSGSLTLESMQSLVYMHAGVISGCISRRLMNYTGIQGISQCIHSILYNINSLLPAIFLMFYHTPQLDDPPSLLFLRFLSGPTPAMPRSPKLYSTSSLPARMKPTTDPNDDPNWLVFSGLTHGPGWCFRDPAKPLVFQMVIVEKDHPKWRILSLKHTILWLSFSNPGFLLIQDKFCCFLA